MLFADFPNSKFWFPEFVSSDSWHVKVTSLVVTNVIYIGNVYNQTKKGIHSFIVLPEYNFAKQLNRSAFILNVHFKKFDTDTCAWVLISWKSSNVLFVL